MSTASIAVLEALRYIFGAIATTGDRRKEAVMDWARMLAYVTGTVDQELLVKKPRNLAEKSRMILWLEVDCTCARTAMLLANAQVSPNIACAVDR